MGITQLVEAAVAQRQRDRLGVVALYGLHQAGRPGRGQGEAFALCHRQRARVGPDDHDDRNADHVQARDIAYAGDAHDGRQPPRAADGLVRRHRTVRSGAIGLDQPHAAPDR